MDRGTDPAFMRRSIRRQVNFAVAHPESLYCDIYTHFRTIYGPRSAEYAYFLAYHGALQTAEALDLARVRDSRS